MVWAVFECALGAAWAGIIGEHPWQGSVKVSLDPPHKIIPYRMGTAPSSPVSESSKHGLLLYPRVLKSRNNLDAAKTKAVRALLHKVVTTCMSYRECAFAAQVGLEASYPTGGRWCVVVGRSMAYNLRFDKTTRSMFTVPALQVDLAKDGTAPPGLEVTFLLFRTHGDETVVPAPTSAPLAPKLTRGEGGEGNGKETGGGVEEERRVVKEEEEKVVTEKKGEEVGDSGEEREIEEVSPSNATLSTTSPAAPPQRRTPTLRPLPKGTSQASTPSANPAGVAHVGMLVGGVVAEVGLHPTVEVDFCMAVKAALTAEYGSTWHVVLGIAMAALAATPLEKGGGGGKEKGAGSLPTSSSSSSTSPLPRRREYTREEVLGYGRVDKGAHGNGVAPPTRCVPGTFLEFDVPPTGALTKAQMASAPQLYRLTLFQTHPGWGEAPPATPLSLSSLSSLSNSPLLSPLLDNPLVTARLLLYALAFLAFLGYTILTHAQDNSCSRVSQGMGALWGGGGKGSVTVSGNHPPPPPFSLPSYGGLGHQAQGAGMGALLQRQAFRVWHSLDVFSFDGQVAEASLGLPSPPAPTLNCTPYAILQADLRVSRGKVLLVASLLSIVVSVLVLRPAIKMFSTWRSKAALRHVSRVAAIEASKKVN